MNIAPVDANQGSAFSPLSGNNAIKLLEKQKQQLQEQIQKVNESKMDDKAKQEEVKLLQDQIEQLDTEILQRRSEILGQGLNSKKSTGGDQSNAASGGEGDNTTGMTQLLQASAVYSRVKVLERTKNSLEGKINGLKTEIKLDEERGCDTKAKKKELHDMEYSEKVLNRKAGETLKTARKHMREASREKMDDTQTISRNDDKNNQDTISISKTGGKIDIKA